MGGALWKLGHIRIGRMPNPAKDGVELKVRSPERFLKGTNI